MIRSAKDKRKAIEGLSSIITAANAAALAVKDTNDAFTSASRIKKQAKRAFQRARDDYNSSLKTLESAFADETARSLLEEAESERRQTEKERLQAEAELRRQRPKRPPATAPVSSSRPAYATPEPKKSTPASRLMPIPSFEELGEKDFLHFLKRLLDEAFFLSGIDIDRVCLGAGRTLVISASTRANEIRGPRRWEHTLVDDVEKLTTDLVRQACISIEQQAINPPRTKPTTAAGNDPAPRVAVVPAKTMAPETRAMTEEEIEELNK